MEITVHSLWTLIHGMGFGALYLLASSGKFITGEVLTVDGGQQMWGDPWPTGRPEWFRT